jgi:glycosyltransferase involved in cell wall biosynthesis
LVTFRRPAELSIMLSRLSAQERALDRLVVVDNSPTPEAAAAVAGYAAEGHDATYVEAPQNLGPAGGIALGMNRIAASVDDRDWLVLLDDDSPPYSPSLLRDLQRFGDSQTHADPRTGAVGVAGARFDLRRARLVRPRDEELDGPVPVDCIGGNQFPLYRATALRQVGPTSAELFFGLEELDYGLRLREAGYSLYASGPLCRERRETLHRLGLKAGPGLRLDEPTWRRYYSLRNLLHILRVRGRTAAAVHVAVTRGFMKPVLNLPLHPRRGWRHLRLNALACRDALIGRMGRTMEPTP